MQKHQKKEKPTLRRFFLMKLKLWKNRRVDGKGKWCQKTGLKIIEIKSTGSIFLSIKSIEKRRKIRYNTTIERFA